MKLANCFFGKVVFLLFLLCFVLISANAQIKKAEAVSSYFYNKYTTQQVNRYTDNGSWSYLGTSHSGAQGYSNYGFSPVTGYTTSGSWISAPNASAGATYYGIGDAKTLYKYVAVGSAWWNYYDNGWEYDQEQYQKTATVTLVDAQGTLVQSNIVALDGTYPNNGKHSDGYWYIKGSVVNNAPSIEVINPTNNQTFSNMPTYNSLHISGSSQDLDVGNTITIKYQIDSGTPQTIQTLVSNGMSQIFGPLNIAVSSSLTEGSHILKVWAEDNFNDQSSITTRTFNVDRTAPTIPELSLVSKTETNVKLAWTSSTDVSGISKYDVYHGTMLLATVTDTTYTVQWLTPGTAYNFSIIAVDNAGNVTSSNILNVTTSDETPPTPPTGLSVLNKTLSS
ncbi:MAG: fibronectin type III domain-containing protein, partial [Paenibacillaceae bacterium]|nr:fibronectin type III domain-containing protein [Paenibacillaceae bacterium]